MSVFDNAAEDFVELKKAIENLLNRKLPKAEKKNKKSVLNDIHCRLDAAEVALKEMQREVDKAPARQRPKLSTRFRVMQSEYNSLTTQVDSIVDTVTVNDSAILLQLKTTLGLGQTLGLASKGNIYVNTEKPQYYPGELVNGNVFVDFREPVQCDAVVVRCKGTEKVYWQEMRTRIVDDGDNKSHFEEYAVNFDGKKEFFKMKIPLSQGRMYVPAGQWVYPFQFTLPMDLPASFEFKGGNDHKIKAKIEYSFIGTVDVKGAFAKDLKGKTSIQMFSMPLNMIPPGRMTTTETVRLCCCIPRGDVQLTVEADKGAYFIGETAQMHVEVDNRSTSNIDKMKAKFYRILTLRASQAGNNKTLKHLMSELHYDGCISGDQLDQHQQLPLTGEYLPVTNSKHITCEYRIEVECAIPWCRDVDLCIPVGLYEPVASSWGYQAPVDLTYYPPPVIE